MKETRVTEFELNLGKRKFVHLVSSLPKTFSKNSKDSCNFFHIASLASRIFPNQWRRAFVDAYLLPHKTSNEICSKFRGEETKTSKGKNSTHRLRMKAFSKLTVVVCILRVDEPMTMTRNLGLWI